MQFIALSLLAAATIAFAAPAQLVERQLLSSTRYDIERKTGCKPYTVIYARGTTEAGKLHDLRRD